ncbi:MAG TPA: hypothetical protein VH497_09160 [Vicinamibacterales bacterium]|jgi:hypothetical protein
MEDISRGGTLGAHLGGWDPTKVGAPVPEPTQDVTETADERRRTRKRPGRFTIRPVHCPEAFAER